MAEYNEFHSLYGFLVLFLLKTDVEIKDVQRPREKYSEDINWNEMVLKDNLREGPRGTSTEANPAVSVRLKYCSNRT